MKLLGIIRPNAYGLKSRLYSSAIKRQDDEDSDFNPNISYKTSYSPCLGNSRYLSQCPKVLSLSIARSMISNS